jgi:hypothetical protein
MPTLVMCEFLSDAKYTIKLHATEIPLQIYTAKVLTPFQAYIQSHYYS